MALLFLRMCEIIVTNCSIDACPHLLAAQLHASAAILTFQQMQCPRKDKTHEHVSLSKLIETYMMTDD